MRNKQGDLKVLSSLVARGAVSSLRLEYNVLIRVSRTAQDLHSISCCLSEGS